MVGLRVGSLMRRAVPGMLLFLCDTCEVRLDDGILQVHTFDVLIDIRLLLPNSDAEFLEIQRFWFFVCIYV